MGGAECGVQGGGAECGVLDGGFRVGVQGGGAEWGLGGWGVTVPEIHIYFSNEGCTKERFRLNQIHFI